MNDQEEAINKKYLYYLINHGKAQSKNANELLSENIILIEPLSCK